MADLYTGKKVIIFYVFNHRDSLSYHGGTLFLTPCFTPCNFVQLRGFILYLVIKLKKNPKCQFTKNSLSC